MAEQETGMMQVKEGALSFDPTGGFVHALDLTTRQGKIAFAAAVNGDPEKLGDNLGKTIFVRAALAHQVTIVSERTGEVSPAIRLVIFDESYKPYQCVSNGAWESLRRLTMMFGPLPWNDPVPLVPKQRSTSGGRRMYYFDLDASALHDNGGGGTGSAGEADGGDDPVKKRKKS